MEYEPILSKSNSSLQSNFVAIPISFEQRLRSIGDSADVASPRRTWDDVIDGGFIARKRKRLTRQYYWRRENHHPYLMYITMLFYILCAIGVCIGNFFLLEKTILSGLIILPLSVPTAVGMFLTKFMHSIRGSLQLNVCVIIYHIFFFTGSIFNMIIAIEPQQYYIFTYYGLGVFFAIAIPLVLFCICVKPLQRIAENCWSPRFLFLQTFEKKKITDSISSELVSRYAYYIAIEYPGILYPILKVKNKTANPVLQRMKNCFCARKESTAADISQKHTYQYAGQMIQHPKRNGLTPHGYGEFIDDHPLGESIRAYFEFGVPIVGISIATKKKNVVQKLHIVFASNHGTSSKISDTIENLRFGIAIASVSISGHFYKKYPSVKVTQISDFLSTVFPSYKSASLLEERFQSLAFKEYIPHLSNSEFGISSSRTEEGRKMEAVVFIPGYNHSFVAGIKEMGQFSGLVEFPPNFVPFVYSWPGGKLKTYLESVKTASSRRICEDFKLFMVSITSLGFNKIHILTHSMGARVALGFVEYSDLIEETFQLMYATDEDKIRLRDSTKITPTANLASVTFAAPDFEVDAFQKCYWKLIRFCRNVTVYSDIRDQALSVSQTLRQSESLGKKVNSFKDMKYLDLIDCSHLEHNTNWNFHNYFFMNLSITGDIRDIIVNKKRGHQRGERLIAKHSFQNSFQFKSVPSGLGLN